MKSHYQMNHREQAELFCRIKDLNYIRYDSCGVWYQTRNQQRENLGRMTHLIWYGVLNTLADWEAGLIPMEIKEARTTSLYTTCRICKCTVAPQMMNAVFQRKDESEPWRLVAWECLPCTRYGYPDMECAK